MSSIKVDYEENDGRWKCKISDGELTAFGYNADRIKAYEQAVRRFDIRYDGEYGAKDE